MVTGANRHAENNESASVHRHDLRPGPDAGRTGRVRAPLWLNQ